MTTIIIIQARMESTRFPGKMMADLLGKTVIGHVISRVKKCKLVDKIVLATTTSNEDDLLESEAKKEGISVFRGSEDDVLDRFYQAAKKYEATIVVRITGDCPLIDPKIIDKTINFFNNEKCDYASNTNPPTFPDGMDAEVFSFNSLEKAWKNAKLKSEREHVTPYIKKNEEIFSNKNLENEQDISKYRMTIDEAEDLIAVKRILENINDKENYGLSDIMKVLESDKKIIEINRKYERNEGYKISLEKDEEI